MLTLSQRRCEKKKSVGVSGRMDRMDEAAMKIGAGSLSVVVQTRRLFLTIRDRIRLHCLPLRAPVGSCPLPPSLSTPDRGPRAQSSMTMLLRCDLRCFLPQPGCALSSLLLLRLDEAAPRTATIPANARACLHDTDDWTHLNATEPDCDETWPRRTMSDWQGNDGNQGQRGSGPARS